VTSGYQQGEHQTRIKEEEKHVQTETLITQWAKLSNQVNTCTAAREFTPIFSPRQRTHLK
jgi:hypothetical protein